MPSPVLVDFRKLRLALSVAPGNFTWECMCSVGSICVTGLESRDSRTLLVRTFRESGNQDVRGFTTLSRTARVVVRILCWYIPFSLGYVF